MWRYSSMCFLFCKFVNLQTWVFKMSNLSVDIVTTPVLVLFLSLLLLLCFCFPPLQSPEVHSDSNLKQIPDTLARCLYPNCHQLQPTAHRGPRGVIWHQGSRQGSSFPVETETDRTTHTQINRPVMKVWLQQQDSSRNDDLDEVC